MRVFMKRCLMAFLFCVALVMTSCTKEEMTIGEIGNSTGEKITVTAYVDNNDTKVTSDFNSAEKKYAFTWEEDDSFSVIRGGFNETFTKTEAENSFTGTKPDGDGIFYAIHPVTEATSHTAATFDISDQSDDAAYVLYSSTDEINTFKFKHAMAYLRLTLPVALNDKVCDITVTAPAGVFTHGTINLENGALSYENCSKNYINLNNKQVSGEPILVAVPPMEADNKTLQFSVYSSDGKYYEGTLSGSAEKAIEAGKYYTANVSLEESIPYVTFTAVGEQTLNYLAYYYNYDHKPYNGNDVVLDDLEWSSDKSNWKSFNGSAITFGTEQIPSLYVRTKNPNPDGTLLKKGSSGYPAVWGKFVFGTQVKVRCTGDIRTLINWDGYTNVSTEQAQLCGLFRDCSQLISAPNLPATTLAEYCYQGMFQGCTNLTTAPSLPATTLATSCYNQMFMDCTSLTTAPSLPATTLATSCYYNMFKGCIGLQTAPELQATTLAKECYYAMFQNCESLTTAPSLPATTLAEYCYGSMFSGCTGVEAAPALPATTLQKGCYNAMFSGCTSLTQAPVLRATTMVESCYNQMFEGCTGLEAAPALGATELAKKCYRRMFFLCKKLTAAPALPATTLAEECYIEMFSNCTGLQAAPVLPATTLATSCYKQMFSGCTSLTTAPSLPATTLAASCYNYMFYNCTGLQTAPELPATTLATSCYYYMFNKCTNLNYIKMLATNISASNCLYKWMEGVAATGTFTKAASMTSLPTNSVSGIPSGWTVKNDGE